MKSSLPLDMMTGQIKYLRLSIWSSSGCRVFFNEKRSIGQAKWIQEIFHHTIVQDTHVLCDKRWLLCVLVWRRWSLKESKSSEGYCARWLKGWFFSSGTMGMVTTKIFSHTFNPAAAAGPFGSIVCTYTGLEPRTTNPNPTASLLTWRR